MATLSSLLTTARSVLFPTTPEGHSAGCELATTDGRTLALVGARLVGEATGGIARLVLEQRFANRYAEILNVVYRMPLPADGAVSGYEFEIGERTIKGTVDKKQRARERFEQAIVEGKTAALLEQERADIFTQKLGNIPAGETVIARITIDQKLVWLPEGEWELRFPTVIGPRYISQLDSVADAKATHVKVADRSLGELFATSIAVKDKITGGGKPTSPTHAVTVTDGVVSLASGVRLDRDLAIRWRVAAQTPGLSLASACRPGGDAYGLLTIVPPVRGAAKPVARDLVLLIDTSGSMGGAPLTAAKQVLGLMIGTLGDGDQLEMIEFSSSPNRWKPEPVTTDAKTRAAAQAWVNSLEAGGATEMRTAVISALKPLRIGAQRQVVLVTDGYVGGEQQILEELHRKLPASCRMHFLGVGSACNRSLAQAVARAGRGAEVIVGPDEDPERGAKRLLDRTRLPMLTNVEISGSALQRHAPEKIPDVFEAAPLVAALAIDPNGGELVVRGRVADDDWQQVITVPAQQPGDGNQAFAALYGRERVADVEAHAMFESRDGEIEDLGMTYQIATKMTSWVAIDDSRIVTGPSRDELVPQELPYGTSMQAFGLRQAHIAMPMQAPAFPMGGFAGLPPAPGGVARGLAGPPPGSAYEQLKHLITDDAPAESVDADEGDFGEQEHTGSFAKADKKAEEAPKSVPSHAAPQYMPQSIAPQQQPLEKRREAATVSRAPAPAEPQKSVTRSSSTRWLLALVVALLAIIAALLWWLLA